MKIILIIDCESQYTKLISKTIRKFNVCTQIIHYSNFTYDLSSYHTNNNEIVGIIFSGSSYSINEENAPNILWDKLDTIPILAICYSAQSLAYHYGANICSSKTSEFGNTTMMLLESDAIWNNISQSTSVWMSHNDHIEIDKQNKTIQVLSKTTNDIYSSFRINNKIGFLFHPEVTHTKQGEDMIYNFLEICNCDFDWTFENVIATSIQVIKQTVQNDNVIMAVSGGVDSTVAATLIHKAIGNQLHCVFINNGCLRFNEQQQVMQSLSTIGLSVEYLDHSQLFLDKLTGIQDPETKRKIIGEQFIDSFVLFANSLQTTKQVTIQWLAQGTIYSDVIESSFGDRKIKSHHNVGGLPDHLPYQLLEPLKMLFKDEVRKLGNSYRYLMNY